MAKLEDICLNFLIKSCGINKLYEELPDLDFSLYCFIDEFMLMVDKNVLLVCNSPNWDYATELDNFCDWCLFYQDCCMFCGEFNELRRSSRVSKIAEVFVLIFRILNYWNTVNKKVSLKKFKNFRLFFHLICTNFQHGEHFHLLLGDLYNIEGDLVLSEVVQINLSHRSCQKCTNFIYVDFKKLFTVEQVIRI